jgi:hypothetical protein
MVELLKVWCFKGVKNFISLFFCFWFVLLFCRLLWNDLGELVSVMERDPGYLMDILYELGESRLCEWIGAELSWEQGDKEYIYMMLAEVKEDFWRGNEAKF